MHFCTRSTLLAAISYASLSACVALSCTEVVIPVNATATNLLLPDTVNINHIADKTTLSAIAASASKFVKSGQYSIAGRYCRPTSIVSSRVNTIQVLLHGNFYDRNYWFGLADPNANQTQDQYSWVKYAASKGYAILAVDRICNGVSSHPNGLTECQLPMNAVTLKGVMDGIREGAISGIDRSFGQFILVGHSYGSFVANMYSVLYPSDINAYILTGYTDKFANGAVGTVSNPQTQPAFLVDPARYGNLDPLYLEATSANGTKGNFYYGDFDDAIAADDFSHRGTTTTGEGATIPLGAQQSPNYTGTVMVLNGNNDKIFCSPNVLSFVTGQAADCAATGSSDSARSLYPNAGAFAVHNTPNTGHCLNLHFSAQESFAAAHDFLSAQGF